MDIRIKIRRKVKRFLERGFKRRNAIIVEIIGILFLVGGIYNFMLLPQITLDGKGKIYLDYNDIYLEKGYNASFLGKDITKNVKVSGNVNTKKVGSYRITYEVSSLFFTRVVRREIIVQDRRKPQLDIDDSDIYLCPGDEVVPEKVKAFDDYDGDLTEKVKIDIKSDKIIYSVSDNSNNTREVSKKIIYKDNEKPKIKLNGSPFLYLFIGDEFVDPGYDAIDNCDNEISESVKVSGKVNTNKVGEYTITYKVMDKALNEEVVSRKVRVSERDKIGTVYLTFDDGPNSGTTDVILDILKEEGVEATFFVTSKGPDELIKRTYDEGHTVALHTSSHDYARVYSSEDEYFNDLYAVYDRVKRITGYEAKIIRFPGGSSNTISRRYSKGIMTNLTNEVVNRGFKYYDWNISSGDAEFGNHEPSEIADNVIKKLSKERVNMVLMHDIKPYTRDALRTIIKYGKDNGYTFEKITMDTEMVKQKVNN